MTSPNVSQVSRMTKLPNRPSVQRLYQDIGERVRHRRKMLGMVQDDLAATIGLSRASIANLETGRQRMLAHQIFEIADALDMDVADLLGLLPTVPRDVLFIDVAKKWEPIASRAMAGDREDVA